MSDTGLERDPSFLPEVWAHYGIGTTILALRFAVRLKTVGFRGLQMDDLFAFLVLIMYTCDAVTVHLVYNLGSNVEASVFQLQRTLTPEEVEQYTLGSKLQLTAWYSYTALLWSLKGTMLFFFRRITTGLWQARLVRWLTWACLGSYLAVLLTLTFGCFPTSKNWQVLPSPGQQCTFRMQNFLVTVVLNVITDAALLCVPLPLLWALQVPWKKKLVVGLLICSGFFVIAAAIIRVVLTLGAQPSGTNINRWGVRETIVGIISVNIPILRPMFTAAFWTGRGPASSAWSSSSHFRGDRSRTLPAASGPYEMTDGCGKGGKGGGDKGNHSDNASDDCILAAAKPLGNDIYVETVYHIRTDDARRDLGTEGWATGGGRGSRTDVHGASNAV